MGYIYIYHALTAKMMENNGETPGKITLRDKNNIQLDKNPDKEILYTKYNISQRDYRI